MLRKNVAGQFLTIAAVNATTGAALSGATISMRRCLDGTFAAGGATITEDTGLGFYKAALAQADTNGNNVGYFFTATNMVPVNLTGCTTAADPTDAVRFGLTALPNAAVSGVGGLLTAPTTANTGLADVASWLGGVPNAMASGRIDAIAITRGSTATAGTATTLTLDAGASAVDNYYSGQGITWTSGANNGVARIVSSYVGATKVATFAVALPAAADATPTFIVTAIRHPLNGTDGKVLISTDAQDLSATLSVNASRWAGTAITATSIPVAIAAGAAGGLQIAGANAATTYATLTSTGAFSINGVSNVSQTGDSFARIGALGAGLTAVVAASVTGAVGSVTGSVGSIAAGGITAGSFAANSIDAGALATTAVDEIRDGVWAKVEAELAVDPGATPTVLQALMLPYMAIRNLRLTDSVGGTDKIHNSAGAIILTAAISDSGTLFTKAKYA